MNPFKKSIRYVDNGQPRRSLFPILNSLFRAILRHKFTAALLTVALVFGFQLYSLNSNPIYALTATGGTITTNGTKEVHTFTSSGTFTVTGSGDVEALVVGGGGGGGGGIGGGGGAGGYVASSSMAVTGQAYTITVGGGGGEDASGQNSVFGSITSIGGGGGRNTSGLNGGSGGGARLAGQSGGTGTAGQGNNGGIGSDVDPNEAGGGGGGASAVGAAGATSAGGNGGNGTTNSISGSSVTYAGGGGGGAANGSGGTGGSGGGGGGAVGAGGDGTPGTTNTGGGGGGGGSGAGNSGGTGGSGVVIISFVPSSSEGGPTFLMGFEAWMKRVTDEGKFPPPSANFAIFIILTFASAFEYKVGRWFLTATNRAARFAPEGYFLARLQRLLIVFQRSRF